MAPPLPDGGHGLAESRLGEPYLLVDLAFPGSDDPFLEPGRVYDVSWGANVVPAEYFDGLLYMEEADKMTPLAWPPC